MVSLEKSNVIKEFERNTQTKFRLHLNEMEMEKVRNLIHREHIKRQNSNMGKVRERVKQRRKVTEDLKSNSEEQECKFVLKEEFT